MAREEAEACALWLAVVAVAGYPTVTFPSRLGSDSASSIPVSRLFLFLFLFFFFFFFFF